MLTLNQAEVLRIAGFTEKEIREINAAVTPSGERQPKVNISGDQWRAAISSRRAWLARMTASGVSREQFDNIVNNYYEKRTTRKVDVFAFLKAEYRPPARMDFQTAYKARRAKKPSERYAANSTRKYMASTVRTAERRLKDG